MKKLFNLLIIFFLLIQIYSCSKSFANKKEDIDKDEEPETNNKKPKGPKKNPPGQNKKQDLEEPKFELSTIQSLIIGSFIIIFIILLIYFITNKFNKHNKEKEKKLYKKIYLLMKLEKDNNKSQNNNKNENSNLSAPSTAKETYYKLNEEEEINVNEEEINSYTNNEKVDDLNNYNYDKKIIIKPSKEDLQLYKPYHIEEINENNNNSMDIENK